MDDLGGLGAGVEARTHVLVPGFHAVKHAHRFGAELVAVLTVDADRALRLAEELAPDLVPVLERAELVDRPELKALAGEVHPTGIVGVAVKPAVPAGRVPGPGVVLEDPRHLGNVGAAIRAAAALGADSMSCTGDADVWSPAAIRGSAGLHWALDVRGGITFDELSSPLVGFDPEGRPAPEVDIPADALLVFGTERHGLGSSARTACSELVAIPMRQGVSSLNLATAVALALVHRRYRNESKNRL